MTINDDILRYIKDADFIRFVFEGTPSQLNYWRGYIARRPEEKGCRIAVEVPLAAS